MTDAASAPRYPGFSRCGSAMLRKGLSTADRAKVAALFEGQDIAALKAQGWEGVYL